MAKLEYSSPDLLLTTSRVGELLGVHPSTVKRWCESGELVSLRTEGRHRRIHLDHVLDLARRREVDTFLTPFAPYERHVWSALEEVTRHDRFDRLHSLAMGWLVRGRADRVGDLVATLGQDDGLSLARCFDRGVRDFMLQVGEAWREGRLRVGEEHLIAHVLIEAILRIKDGRLARAAGRRPRSGADARPRAVVGAMEDDHHSLGALCIRVLLEVADWDVAYLGADVPVDEFAAMQQDRDAHLVCVSFAPPQGPADMARCTKILREFYREDRPYALALGGEGAEARPLPGDAAPFLELGVFDGGESFLRWLDECGIAHLPRQGDGGGSRNG